MTWTTPFQKTPETAKAGLCVITNMEIVQVAWTASLVTSAMFLA